MRLRNKPLPGLSGELLSLYSGKIMPHMTRTRMIILFLVIFFLLYAFCLPRRLFDVPVSTVLEDAGGKLLGAKIAADGQWRFPSSGEVPGKMEKALLYFEDKDFYRHPGVNPLALGRAMVQNVRAGHVVSGGSTLSMQVIRLSRKGKERSIFEKFIEMVLATRLELRYSKAEILQMYCANAPFGGNIVGMEAASWRYFGRNPGDLSWSESALLAILPNAPSLIYPGKNRNQLLRKRNRLLGTLYAHHLMDSLTWQLSVAEPIPDKPFPLPRLAPHLLEQVYAMHRGSRYRTSIDAELQQSVNHILLRHFEQLKRNEVYNIAALVIEVKTGHVMAYSGNVPAQDSSRYENDVDCIRAPRSTGSILKPLLYASMIGDGELLPTSLVADIPSQFGGFFPKNFDESYDGAVPARRALARSLNVPAVRMLQQHGLEKFHDFLQKAGITSIRFPAYHYGLSLILGGAEASLWDISGIYAGLSRVLNHFAVNNGRYSDQDIREPSFLLRVDGKPEKEPDSPRFSENPALLSAASVWLTYEALVEVNRPDQEASWQSFGSKHRIAWKTGTSYGNRDAWAIGTTPGYVVGVWVGNADGEGRPLLTGVSGAAPILFEIFGLLPSSGWFSQPYDEMVKIPVCRKSGFRAGEYCEETDSVWIQRQGLNTRPCPYHILVHLSPDEKFRVTGDCMPLSKIVNKPWFVLPPAMEWYYRSKNPSYRVLPPYAPGCRHEPGITAMELLYPRAGSKIYIPVEITGEKGKLVMEAIHRNPSGIIFWHLDDTYLGETRRFHKMAAAITPGEHTMTLVDDSGESLSIRFTILSKD